MSRTAEAWPPVETELPGRHEDTPEPGTDLPPHYAYCFGCGDRQEDGLHLRAQVGDGHHIRSRFTVTEAHQGAPGLAHGGLLACAFDEALGTTVGNLLRRPAVTGRLETDFVRPVPVGTTLVIDAHLDGVAGRKVYVSAEGRIDAEDGPVAVRARALFVLVEIQHFLDNGRTEDLRAVAADPSLLGSRPVELNP
ncbi:PaaI family thioesterase [Actinokineospora diospyrosa]|uniref:Acyl-coenzyme A thioesterase THEM4 n=1 Tax=Actinokineospora diospyrosa TaxID=103728 RepID=A0ABT1IKD3_9PSEU|nr:PaaI family thioesterase [Actinokineospora diospyrosa]MCP2273019.1 Acyl-coenzyme A thioesterase PaaI, contains HGG motif [Actinokineospora diospyrosa]